jgi:hypothetical protein
LIVVAHVVLGGCNARLIAQAGQSSMHSSG